MEIITLLLNLYLKLLVLLFNGLCQLTEALLAGPGKTGKRHRRRRRPAPVVVIQDRTRRGVRATRR